VNLLLRLRSHIVVDLSFHLWGGLRGDRVLKSSVDEDYGGETFAGHEETDMASLTERDKGYDEEGVE